MAAPPELIECIPNFSEGRDLQVIDAIQTAIASVPGVSVLDRSSDPDHNRTVITFVGTPEPMLEAAFRGIRAAAMHINMDTQRGVHPRIGAADVVPFVPLRDTDMARCIEIAQLLGQRVGTELGIPVYLYENAATRADRRNLAHVRHDPYERLKTSIESDPARYPDFGPARLGQAGAVAIGARGPLIAFNAFLDTDDVEIAKEIARFVRESGGGVPYLKALGLLVDGRAQVSMNVIDYRQSSLYTILEAVRAEAGRLGARVTETELVGLVPRVALIDAALSYLGLSPEVRERVLETRLGQATGDFRDLTFE